MKIEKIYMIPVTVSNEETDKIDNLNLEVKVIMDVAVGGLS